ncbi:MAG: RagB/SusD family nutrient uptake outer membrane protein [Bacteroidota bacterium]
MKKTKLILLLMMGLTLFPCIQSCTDLNEIVYDKVPTDKFGNTPKEIAALVAPIYNSLLNARSWAFIHLADESADMLVVPTRKGGDWWDGGQHMYTKQHTWTNDNTPLITDAYSNIYSSITTCNQVLKMVEGMEGMAGKDNTIAEIRAVRAFWYYIYIDYFGQGPLVTDFSVTTLPTSKSRLELYNFVISELNAVKDLLRADVSSSSYGKMTKGAAYTILAKMYLNAGVWTGTAQWQKCIDACNVVIGLPYVLEPDWKKTFQVKNEESKEIILPAVFNGKVWGNTIAFQTLHYLDAYALGLNIGPWNGMCADPNYVKEYDPADKRLNWSFLTGPMLDPATGQVLITAHGRPLIHTMDVTMYEASTTWGWCNQEDGARCWKWEIPKGLSDCLENDYAIFRLADVYLMKAECLVRLNGSSAEATTLVNDIRRRAFSPEKPIANVTLEVVRKERRYEMAWEQISRQDNIRFGTFLNAVPGWRGVSDPKHLLFPIPKNARDVNPGLTQNPGY